MRTQLTAFWLASLVFVAGCGGGEERPAAQDPDRTLRAQIETVQSTAVPEVYEAVGTVKSKTSSTLSSKSVGQVVAVHVREGSRVRKGQVLVEVDARDSAAQLDRAEAGVAEVESALEEAEQGIQAAQSGKEAAEANARLATSTYQRFKELRERSSVSQQEFEEAEARYKAAVAEVARAQSMVESLQAKKKQVEAKRIQAGAETQTAQVYVSYSRIQAPFDGLVIAKHAEPGDLAAPGVPLLTVEDNSRYRLEAPVEESRLGLVKPGDKIQVRLDAIGAELDGTVDEIAPQADWASRTFTVKILLPADPQLRSGMFGRAYFPLKEKSILIVPATSVLRKGQLTGVYVLGEGNRASFRLIRLGKNYGEKVEALSGLKSGETIVAVLPSGVQEGVKIEAQRP